MSNPPPSSAAAASASPCVEWPDPIREAAFRAWLERVGPAQRLRPATLRTASADASFRRYLRIDCAPVLGTDVQSPPSGGAVSPWDGPAAKRDDASRIIMDAPPDKENCEPFVKVAALMAEAGLNVPQVLDWDQANGFMLLQDLGSQTMMDVIEPAISQVNQGLYLRAADALVAWQAASRPGVLPVYDKALLARELELFPQWYLGQHKGVAVQGKLRETLDSTFALIIERNLASPQVYVHRDFMPRNLMMPSDPAEQRLGVLDFQDAVYGPISYDIASLMRDAFLSWDEEFVLDITVRYWQRAQKAGLPVDSDFGEFYRAVEWMGLQRHLKVAGIFARLTLRDGKPRYLADTPRFLSYIRATASRYRELTPLLRLVDEVEGTQQTAAFVFGRV